MAEAPLEEIEPLAGDFEDLVGIEVLGERLPAVESERDAPMVLLHGVVLARHHGNDVGRHHRCFWKRPHAARAPIAWSIRNDDPGLRRFDGEREGGLEVGLIEAREAAVSGVLGELAVQVSAPVHRVSEPADPGPVPRIRAGSLDRQGVFGRQLVEPQPAAFDVGQRAFVEEARENGAFELDERAGAGRATSKVDGGLDVECLVVTSEVQPTLVVIDRDERGSLMRLAARQVVMDLVFRSGRRSPMHRPRRPGFADAGVASCARSVTHLRDARPRVLVGSLAPAAKAAPCRPDSRTEH